MISYMLLRLALMAVMYFLLSGDHARSEDLKLEQGSFRMETRVDGHFYVADDEWMEFSGTVETPSPREALRNGLSMMHTFGAWAAVAKKLSGQVAIAGGKSLVTRSSSDSREKIATKNDYSKFEFTSAYGPRSYGAANVPLKWR